MTALKTWQHICHIEDLVDNSGICALLDIEQNKQVAIFSIPQHPEKVFVIDNFDPIGKANVLYRGLVGCAQGQPIVASPLYKQQFLLKTGKCIQESVGVKAYLTRIDNKSVQVCV